MKRKTLFLLLLLFTFTLTACQNQNQVIPYTDDEPLQISMKGDSLAILQLTDLHLTFGFDYHDRQTFQSIRSMIASRDFDLVVITGDLTLSPSAIRLFKKLISVMEECRTPWTFVFGNHETDYQTHLQFLEAIPKDTTYLRFKVGPNLEAGGVGNFRINVLKDSHIFQTLYFMDSHAEVKNDPEAIGIYDYLKPSQVAWYESHVVHDTKNSLMFMHMPLRQMLDYNDITGRNEEDVYPQGKDTGMFDAILRHGFTKGVFFGHDHLNDFHFIKEGVLLAYGLVSGYNAYGTFDVGGRIILVHPDGQLETFVQSRKEVEA